MPAPKPAPPLHTRYRSALVNRILMGALLPPVLVVMVWALAANWPADPMRGGALLATGCILLVVAFVLYVLVATFRNDILLTDSHITKKNTWPLADKELCLDEIAGFRTTNKLIIIEPTRPDLPRLSFQSSIEFHDEFMAWLSSNYPDLDQVESAKFKALLLHDEQLGSTPEARAARLAHAKQVGWALDVLGALVAAWLCFWPRPYTYATLATILVPLLAAVALFLFPKLMRLEAGRKHPQASVSLAVLLPSFSLLVRAFADVDLVIHSAAWPVASGVALLFGGLFAAGSRSSLFEHGTLRRGNRNEWLLLLMCAGAYSYGATLMGNVAFDKQAPTLYQTQVLNKHIIKAKSATYYLLLSPWGLRPAPANVAVGREYYQRKQPGDSVTVATRPGRLGIPWFRIVEE